MTALLKTKLTTFFSKLNALSIGGIDFVFQCRLQGQKLRLIKNFREKFDFVREKRK